MSDKLAKLEPVVSTLARPSPGPLIAARNNVQRRPELKEVFVRAKQQGWTADRLAKELEPVLENRIDGDAASIAQVALYLADEYLQIGDGILLIDPDTGKALARVTDDDIYEPMVPRGEGADAHLVKGLPRLNPSLEGLIVEWKFNRTREGEIAAAMAQRIHQTDLLREEGDTRLLPVTRAGRNQIVEAVREALPKCIPSSSFIRRHFGINEPTGDLQPLLRCVGVAKSLTPIHDLHGLNLRHDQFTAICARTTTQWVRDVSLTIALHAKSVETTKMDYSEFNPAKYESVGTWVADPNFTEVLGRRSTPVLYVESAPLTGLLGRVGVIEIDESSYECRAREFHGRWEVVAKFSYTLWVDWTAIRSFDIENVPVSGVSVEVLR